MTDPQLHGNSESRWRRIRVALAVSAIVASVVVAILSGAGRLRRLSRSELDWAIVAMGLFYGLHVMTDIRRGRTQLSSRGGNLPRYDYVRSADPIGFWILIALQGALAVATIVASLGDLLRLWTL